MTVNDQKDKVQKEALNAWRDKGCKGTCELATGAGKTRIGVIAASHFAKAADYNYKVLIVTPTSAIQDEWRNEFIKWKKEKTLHECVNIQCINTARKYEDEHYDLLIVDEVHRYLRGPVNSKLFENNTFDKILGLSGTIELNLLDQLNRYAPICYSLNLYDAVEMGLVSNFTVYNIPVELTKPERTQYNKYTRAIEWLWNTRSMHSWKNISARKELLYNAKAKIKLVQKLVNMFNKNDYGIIFSMSKNYANTVAKKLGDRCIVQHSGITKKNRALGLKKFGDGRTKKRIISTAIVLDEGVNLPRIQYGILTASSSKGRQQLQRAGRLCRLGEDGKHAIIIRIYCKDTKEEDWLETSQSKLEVVHVDNIQELKKLINNK
jgi:superfamily II DNA or RNA helicase